MISSVRGEFQATKKIRFSVLEKKTKNIELMEWAISKTLITKEMVLPGLLEFRKEEELF